MSHFSSASMFVAIVNARRPHSNALANMSSLNHGLESPQAFDWGLKIGRWSGAYVASRTGLLKIVLLSLILTPWLLIVPHGVNKPGTDRNRSTDRLVSRK